MSSLQARQRLKDDFAFYARNCLTIRTKIDGNQALNLNSAQQYIHKRFEDQLKDTGKVRAIILKGRQQGASTYVEGRFTWKVTHSCGVRAFILTHEAESTDALFEMAERYYQNLPTHVKPSLGASNAKELYFDKLDSGYKIGTAGNKVVGRGQTLQFFHGSEVGFWVNASEHTKGIMQAVPDGPGTEVVLESTANGVGNFFHQQWKLAEKGLSEFMPIFVPWFWQKEYTKEPPEDFQLDDKEKKLKELYKLTDGQMYWRRIKVAELTVDGVNGEASFKQEYPMTAAEAFQMTGGGNTLISAENCQAARKNTVKGNGSLVVGVDPSRGGDRFAIIKRQGRKLYDPQAYIGEQCNTLGKNVSICKRILDAIDPVAGKKPDRMFIDTGAGADLVDRLHELGYQNRVKAIAFGGTPLNPEKYTNKRNEMWGELTAWLTDENLPVEIPDNDEIQADLCASPYDRDSHDRKVLWRKEKILAKFGFSPDFGDASALTHAEPVGDSDDWAELEYDDRGFI